MPDIEKPESIPLLVKDRSVIWPLVVVFVAWIAIIAASILSYQPIGNLGSQSQIQDSAFSFSTSRAMQDLDELVGDSIPHPAGTEQNAVVRQRLISKLESFGYEVQVQKAICVVPKRLKKRTKAEKVEIHNLVAIRKGTEAGKAIALVTHYDSHPAGPGASDDGVGTAALLEIARLYSDDRRTPRRDFVFLITDGEEFGLLGAKAFCDSNPIADEIGLVINLEARGTAGPSMMFETSPMSRALVPVFSRASPKPYSSSLFREIYKRLPNDTDFSVFQRHGKLGYNFAFIGDVRNYHTTADNFENVDPRCLEHHGQNALALIRELQSTSELDALIDEERDSWKGQGTNYTTEAIYFDLLGLCIFWWPANFSIRFGLVICALFFVADWRLKTTATVNEQESFAASWHKAFYFLIGTIVVVIPFGLLLSMLVRFDPRLSNPWPSQPVAILTSYWFASFALIGGATVRFKHVLSPRACWYAWVFFWMVAAAASSIFLVGASFLFIVPVLVATLVTAVFAKVFNDISGPQGDIMWSLVFAAVASGLMWFPLERLFYDAVGFKMTGLSFFRIAMMGTSLIGLLSLISEKDRFRFSMLAVFVSVLALIFAIATSS